MESFFSQYLDSALIFGVALGIVLFSVGIILTPEIIRVHWMRRLARELGCQYQRRLNSFFASEQKLNSIKGLWRGEQVSIHDVRVQHGKRVWRYTVVNGEEYESGTGSFQLSLTGYLSVEKIKKILEEQRRRKDALR